MYTHPNQEFVDDLIKEYDTNLHNLGISMIDKLYQEVPTDYFESDRFNHTIGVVLKWISYLPDFNDSFRDNCWPVFRDHTDHSFLTFSEHYAEKGEGKLSLWGTPMSKSEWEKDWLFFSGSIWKSKSESIQINEISPVRRFPTLKSLSYSFFNFNFTHSALYTKIDTRILNAVYRSNAIEMLGI